MLPYLVLAAVVPAVMGFGDVLRRQLEVERRLHHPLGQTTRHTAGAAPGRQCSEQRRPWTFFDHAALAVLVVFSAVRTGIGTDYREYTLIYNRVDTADWLREITTAPQEAGFTLLMLAVRTVDPTPTTFFWVTSILTVVPVFVAIRQVSARPVLAVLLYILLGFYLLPFNVVRQGIAISLVFWAVTCLRHRRVALVLVSVAAISVHATVVVILAVIWLARRWRPTPWSIGLVLAGAVVALLTFDRFSALTDLVSRLNPRYESYLAAASAGTGTYLQIVVLLGLLVYAAVLGRQREKVRERTGWMLALVLIGVALMIVSTAAVPFARLAAFFTIFLVLLLPERVAVARQPVVHDVALVVGGAAFYVFYLSFYGGLTPYQTYLF